MRQEVPRLVRGALETAVRNETCEIEERLKIQIVEYIRLAQDQAFSNYRATTGVSATESGAHSTQQQDLHAQCPPQLSSNREHRHSLEYVLEPSHEALPPQDGWRSAKINATVSNDASNDLPTMHSTSGYVGSITGISEGPGEALPFNEYAGDSFDNWFRDDIDNPSQLPNSLTVAQLAPSPFESTSCSWDAELNFAGGIAADMNDIRADSQW